MTHGIWYRWYWSTLLTLYHYLNQGEHNLNNTHMNAAKGIFSVDSSYIASRDIAELWGNNSAGYHTQNSAIGVRASNLHKSYSVPMFDEDEIENEVGALFQRIIRNRVKFRWCSLGKSVFISVQTLDIDFQLATTRFYLFVQRQYTVLRLSNGSVSATETQHSSILFTYRGLFEGIAIKHMLNVLFQNMTCFISTCNSIIYLIPLIMVEAASR